MDYREITARCYAGDATAKTDLARQFAKEFQHEMLKNSGIVRHIEVVKEAVVDLDAQMSAMEMGKMCTVCAATPGGGCCSHYMGNENNDALQLLMNLLVGIDVKAVRADGVECCFLGESGCILLFKPIFCLNYLCHRIQEESAAEDLQMLERDTGKLLGAQVELEQMLICFLQNS